MPIGTTGNDLITGTAGSDVIVGLAGNDTLQGGGGADVIYGDDSVAGGGAPGSIGSEVLVNESTTGQQTQIKLMTLANGNIMAMWHSAPGNTGTLNDNDTMVGGYMARVLSPNGQPIGAEFAISDGNETVLGLAPLYAWQGGMTQLANGDIVFAWADDTGRISARILSPLGFAGPQFQLTSDLASSFDTAPHLAADADGGFRLVYQPASAVAGFDVFTRSFDATGAPVAGSASTLVNTFTGTGPNPDQGTAQITQLTDGGHVVVWNSLRQGETDEPGDFIAANVYFQRYDADGLAVGGETLVHPGYTTGAQLNPAITAMADGGYIIAWQSFLADGAGNAVMTRRYAADGTPGPEVQVNTTATGDQIRVKVVELAQGGHVVVWQSEEQDGDLSGVFYRVYDVNGTPGTEMQANITTAGRQGFADVTAMPFATGGFVIAWTSGNGQDGDGAGIYSRAFDMNGAPMTGAGDDSIRGGTGNDRIFGGGGLDTIWGETGKDLIEGEDGDDRIDGGADNDTLRGGAGDDSANGSTGDDRIEGGDGFDTITGDTGDDTIKGGNDDDSLSGGIDDDTISGDGGADTLAGGAGADTLAGGADDDRLAGDAGNDSLHGDDGRDTVAGGTGNDKLFGDLDDDTLSGDAGNDTLDGGDGADVLKGGAGNDSVIGGTGNDTATGGSGNDVILGNDGDDSINGDDGNDKIDGGNGNDLLIGRTGNDTIAGVAGNDTLDAGRGNDVLNGGAGDDMLTGGLGKDVMTGGSGADTFVFDIWLESPNGTNRDTITDFTAGQDRIDLSSLDADDGIGGNQTFAFTGTTAAANSVWYVVSGGNRIVRADVDGNTGADVEIQLTGTGTLTAADFIL